MTGLSYEEEALNKHLLTHGDKCPVTNQPLLPTIPNNTLKRLIEEIPNKLKKRDSFSRRYRQFFSIFINVFEALGIRINKDYFLPAHVEQTKEIQDIFTKDKFVSPIVIADGNTYEEDYIKQWVSEHRTSPKTSRPLEHFQFCTNRDLMRAIESIEKFLEPEREINISARNN